MSVVSELSDPGFQIVGVKKTAKAGVLLRVANERQLKILESVDAIKSVGLLLEKPKGLRFRIIVKVRTRFYGRSCLPNNLISLEYQERVKIK